MILKEFIEKVGDFLIFLETEKNVSRHTLRAYRTDLYQLIQFWERISKQEKAVTLTLDRVVKRYIVSLFYQKIAKTTLARKLSCLRSIETYLQTQGIDLHLQVKSPRLDKKLPVTLSVDEIFYLLDEVTIEQLPTKYPYRDKAVMEVLYATGVRCSELTNIILNDVDMQEKTIRVMGKGRRERIVLFGSKAKRAIERYIQNERALFGFDDTSHLFVSGRGNKLNERTVQRICEMFRKLLKVDRQLTPHKIRHSFATHLLNQGVGLRVIQELLGHQTIATTEVYTHVSSTQLARMCDDKHPLNTMAVELPGMKKKE